MSTDHQSNLSLNETAEVLRQAASPIVTLTHRKPDGDALGSVLAMTIALHALGKQVQGILIPPVAESISNFQFNNMLQLLDETTNWPDNPGLVVVVDTGAMSQLADAAPFVQKHPDKTLIIDHHLSGDADAKYRYVDPKAAACCEIIAELTDHLLHENDNLSDEAKNAINNGLFLGLASDTGWFRFSNTTPRTHRLAARLLGAGVDHAEIYQRTEQCERIEKVHLLTRALDKLEVLADGQAALMKLYESDFADTGAFEHETERLIDVPQQVGEFQLICLAVEKTLEPPSGQRLKARSQTRLSFRSKPGPDAVNVATLAEKFGGGGHARAAGATVDKPIADVLPELRQAMNQAQ